MSKSMILAPSTPSAVNSFSPKLSKLCYCVGPGQTHCPYWMQKLDWYMYYDNDEELMNAEDLAKVVVYSKQIGVDVDAPRSG